MLFPVWSSALIHTDWQSNALTPSIRSLVTSSMGLYIHIYELCGCTLLMLLVMWLLVAVLCVLSEYTQYTGHRQDFCIHIYLYVLQHTCVQYIIIIHFHVSIFTTCICSRCTYTLLQFSEDMLCISTWIYINTECFGKPVLTHASVWIVCGSACGLYTTSTMHNMLITYIRWTIYIPCTTIQTQPTINTITVHTYYINFVILWFNAFAEPSTCTYLILALICLLKGNLRYIR